MYVVHRLLSLPYISDRLYITYTCTDRIITPKADFGAVNALFPQYQPELSIMPHLQPALHCIVWQEK